MPCGSRTRLARFLLSLPVPGEDWPVFVRMGAESRRLTPPPADTRHARRVLCLTATPFNNAFEDIVTQIGHFGRSQTWLVSRAEAAGQLTLEGFSSPLLDALGTWASTAGGTPDDQAQRLAALSSVLETVAVPREGRTTAHLRSGRALDPDPAKAEFDEETLKGVAETTGGRYFRATSVEKLGEIYAEIGEMEKTEVKTREYMNYRELFPILLLPGLLMLGLESLLANTRFRRIP